MSVFLKSNKKITIDNKYQEYLEVEVYSLLEDYQSELYFVRGLYFYTTNTGMRQPIKEFQTKLSYTEVSQIASTIQVDPNLTEVDRRKLMLQQGVKIMFQQEQEFGLGYSDLDIK